MPLSGGTEIVSLPLPPLPEIRRTSNFGPVSSCDAERVKTLPSLQHLLVLRWRSAWRIIVRNVTFRKLFPALVTFSFHPSDFRSQRLRIALLPTVFRPSSRELVRDGSPPLQPPLLRSDGGATLGRLVVSHYALGGQGTGLGRVVNPFRFGSCGRVSLRSLIRYRSDVPVVVLRWDLRFFGVRSGRVSRAHSSWRLGEVKRHGFGFVSGK